MIPLPESGLYAITDCQNLDTHSLLEKTEIILMSGAALLQYRNKSADNNLKYDQSKQLQILCKKYHVPFIINDDVELALTLRTDGVHLGRDDTDYITAKTILGPGYIIGVSCYNDLNRAIQLEESDISYVAFGAFFPTTTKKNTATAKPDLIKEARQKLSLPLVAIGGITPENGKVLVKAGTDFIASASGIYGAIDLKTMTEKYIDLFNTKKKQ